MTPYFEQDGVTLYHGDCREILAGLPDESVSAVVTDPPYGLAFMGKRWDYDVPNVEVWQECLRILKPGGHLLAFAGTRTQHRMAVRIEDAGFEIRDMIAWVYGSGFPKSLDVSKAIETKITTGGSSMRQLRQRAMGADYEPHRLAGTGAFGAGRGGGFGADESRDRSKDKEITIPEAKQWQGWGTALKPSQETITWARKPLTADGERDTIAANLIRLETKIWLLWNALRADASSASSQSEYGEALSIAQWNAGNVTSTQGVLCEEMGTSQYAWALSTCWNIVQSWRRRWAGVWSHGNTSIISTVASQIIDLKTLSCCLLQITPENMLRAVSQAGGLKSTADTVVRFAYDYFAYCEGILTLSATESAIAKGVAQFQGEAVKPNLSPIVIARKPLIGTVAENVLQHGTGAINVDGCRVGTSKNVPASVSKHKVATVYNGGWDKGETPGVGGHDPNLGRWPANLIHDGSEEVTGLFPAECPGGRMGLRNGLSAVNAYGDGLTSGTSVAMYNDTGSAARFFYSAKADKADRGPGNNHPTVKPLDLMRYLVRLVCPIGGVVLDPFSGSGTTLAAAQAEGCLAIGVEREAAYCEIIKGRFHQRRLF